MALQEKRTPLIEQSELGDFYFWNRTFYSGCICLRFLLNF